MKTLAMTIQSNNEDIEFPATIQMGKQELSST
jgi:hypothetical protein